MKKIITILVLAIFLAGAGFLAYAWLLVPSDALAVFIDEGTVFYKKQENDDYVQATEEQKIPNHSYVKTDEGGIADIVLPDNSIISMSANTEMKINYSPESTNIFQTLGNAWFRVQKLAGREDFKVETPTSVASVRGTIFGVERGRDSDVIYVTEHSVEIASLVEVNGEKVKKNPEILEENKIATIARSEQAKTVIKELSEEKKQTPWFKRNIILNEQFRDVPAKKILDKAKESENFSKVRDEINEERAEKLGLDTNSLPNTANFLENMTDTSWLSEGGGICKFITTEEYKSLETKIANSNAPDAWKAWVKGIVSDVKTYCSDGNIDAQEAESLRAKYKDRPQQSFLPSEPTVTPADKTSLKERRNNIAEKPGGTGEVLGVKKEGDNSPKAVDRKTSRETELAEPSPTPSLISQR